MKRRQALQSLAGIPGAAALPLPALADTVAPRSAVETPKTPVTAPDAVAGGVPRFFSPEQFAALKKLAEILLPAHAGAPGAREAEAADFLDFLIGHSPADHAGMYREGLDQLGDQARRRHQKTFAELTPEEARPILTPLTEPWTYHGPADPLARFLVAAKEDVFAATMNSRAWAVAMSRRSRSAGGLGTYWFPVED
jgi:hypothetical protein